jgi:hypothetical protein
MMIRRVAMLSILLCTLQHGVAQAQSPATSLAPRPTRANVTLLCNNISTRRKDEDENSDFLYQFEKTLWEISGARPGVDTKGTAESRVAAMWSAYHDDFICDTAGLKNGTILEYAVFNEFEPFLSVAVDYGIDLNVRNPATGKTVLDYLREQLDRATRLGTQEEKGLRSMFGLLTAKGHAKYSADLPR